MTRPLNIACLQTRPKPDFDSALSEALVLAEAAAGAGAGFITLPEYCGGLQSQGSALVPPAAPEQSHPVLKGLQDFAAKRSIWMLIGSLAVSGPRDKIINRSFVINDVGEIVGRYDKIHMFDIQLSETEVYRESTLVEPGNQAIVVDTDFGRLGLSVCYDLRFPHLYRDLAQAGAEIIMVPAAFTKKTGEAHWHVLNRARAIENGAFVVAPCAIGPVNGGGESYGHSLIVDPWGKVVADGRDLPGVVHGRVDLDQVAEVRKRIPSLTHDRSFTFEDTKRGAA